MWNMPPWGQSPQPVVYIPVPNQQQQPGMIPASSLKEAKEIIKLMHKSDEKKSKATKEKEEAEKKKEADKKKPSMLTFGQALLLSLVSIPFTVPFFVGLVLGAYKLTKFLIAQF